MKIHELPEVLRLSTAEKILLVEALWDCIAEEGADLPLPESHRRTLEERWARYLASRENALTLDELKQCTEAWR